MYVSRLGELGTLDELLDGLRAGRGGSILLRGDAGMGKTTLLDALVERCGDEITVLHTRGVETEAELAFSALRELLSPGLDRLATLRLSGGGRAVTARAGTGGDPLPRGPIGPFLNAELRRVDGETVALRWDATRHPMVMVRNPATGSILSFARGGETRIASDAGELELVFSDGVRSAVQRTPVQR